MSNWIVPPKQMRELIVNPERVKRLELAAEILKLAKYDGKGDKEIRITHEVADSIIYSYLKHKLDLGEYAEVASVLWDETAFTPEPESVREIWESLRDKSEIIIIGAGSMGKSYTAAVWYLLDWLRDPLFTCIKILSTSKEHAKRNIFAHIKNLYKSACIKLPGKDTSSSIQANDDDKQGIHLVAIPSGENGKGRLRGFHPVPRPEHPQFGEMSRIRAGLDEAEEIPPGVWEDIDNLLLTKYDAEHVKIFAATNPKNRNSQLGIRCEPPAGWDTVDVDTGPFKWESKQGWHVVRLDGARCENVILQDVVYPGLLAYEGYERLQKRGENNPTYLTMGRGFFPSGGVYATAIAPHLIEYGIGTYLFVGRTTFISGVDLAFEGDDLVIQAIGKYGLATGWINQRGEVKMFKEPRVCIQLEQLFQLQKADSVKLAAAITKNCKLFSIPSTYLGVDRSGSGSGCHDILCNTFGADVVGVVFGEKATDMTVFGEDAMKASDLYSGLHTEMFFSVGKFLEFDYLKFSPTLDIASLRTQLTDRKFKQVENGKVRLERKPDFKKRWGFSPDHADAVSVLVHVARLRSEMEPVMIDSNKKNQQEETSHGIVDQLPTLNWSD